jgi:hypothetical protein
MPMDFPDYESLKRTAEMWKFRKPLKAEKEESFRVALADHVKDKDFIESCEIRFKVGWNQWSDDQKAEMLLLGM